MMGSVGCDEVVSFTYGDKPDELHVGRACSFCVVIDLGLQISSSELPRVLRINVNTIVLAGLALGVSQQERLVVCGRDVAIRCDNDDDVKKGCYCCC